MIAALLVACTLTVPQTTYIEGECPLVEASGQCSTGPVCVPVADATAAGYAYALQCGGTGTAENPGDSDDCIQVPAAHRYTLGDASGDLACASCTDIDGDTGPSDANPWTYIRIGIWDCGADDTGAADYETW